VKVSRDITIGSKRLIFLLHRYNEDPVETKERADADLVKLRELLERIPLELEGVHDYYRYLRAFSPGVQEYIEAASFYHFLVTNTLITKQKLEADIQQAGRSHRPFHISDTDYLYGLADLTGELMRLGVNSVATRNPQLCFQLLGFMQRIHEFCAGLPLSFGEWPKKLAVMKESVQKIEAVCFAVHIRGSEYPPSLLADMAAAYAVDSGGGAGGGSSSAAADVE